MNSLTNFLFSAIFAVATIHPLIAAERDDLYESGSAAFKDKNYCVALKNLFAFYVLNEKYLNEHPDLKKTLEKKIAEAESVVSLLMATNTNFIVTDEGVRIIPRKGDGGFFGNGKKIEDLFLKGKLDLKKISLENQKQMERR